MDSKCSITYSNGKRVFYERYADFAMAKDAIKFAELSWASYYDSHGDTHICLYRSYPGTVQCLGHFARRPENPEIEAHDIATDMIKDIRWDEFLGWSI